MFKGISIFGFGGSIRAGYLNIRHIPKEEEVEVEAFLQGYGGSVAGGYIVGYAEVHALGGGWATEIAITSPDISVSAGHSWMIYDKK